jgi:hypothetical protein
MAKEAGDSKSWKEIDDRYGMSRWLPHHENVPTSYQSYADLKGHFLKPVKADS